MSVSLEGCGFGEWIVAQAQAAPEKNFIAMEVRCVTLFAMHACCVSMHKQHESNQCLHNRYSESEFWLPYDRSLLRI